MVNTPSVILRPDAVVLPDRLAEGLEVCIESGRVQEIRPWTSSSRDEQGLVLSPAFVNAHSHMEYYDLVGAISGKGYWEWIAELTRRKAERDPSAVREAAKDAARQNLWTGVWAVGEWSDWEGSDEAMAEVGLEGCIFQEVITFREWQDPREKLREVRDRAGRNRTPSHVTPHAPYTVAPQVIADIASEGRPMSIHAAETDEENRLYRGDPAVIRDAYREAGIEFRPSGSTAIGYLDSLGALRPGTQIVHACAASHDDVTLLRERGCVIAHCPRSNTALGCPTAPVAEMLEAGIPVGLGLDSAASSGAIDMFAEMREALAVARGRLSAEQVWRMAIDPRAVPGLRENEVRVGCPASLLLVRAAPCWEALVTATPRQCRRVGAL